MYMYMYVHGIVYSKSRDGGVIVEYAMVDIDNCIPITV